MTDHRATARRLAHEALQRRDPLGWFDELYRRADGDSDVVPWADFAPNPNLLSWLDAPGRAVGPTSAALKKGDWLRAGRAFSDVGRPREVPVPFFQQAAKRALVVGCGLGDDAEELARCGFDVVAFDISPTAVDWCKRRFPGSRVQYRVVDLFAPLPHWHHAFGFVFEAYTLQVLPRELHAEASRRIAGFVASGGTLLVITRGREPDDDPGQMPWPLTRADLRPFSACGLKEMRFEDYLDNEQPPVRRFRIQYRRE